MAQTVRGAESATEGTPATRTLVRGLLVLEVVASEEGIGVSEVAARVNLDKGTVSRLLSTLGSLGYVRQRADRRFEVGSRAAWLGHRYSARTDAIRLAAEPHLLNLCELSQETVHLAVPDGLHVVYIAQQQPDRAVRVDSAVGTRLPLQRTAMGRAILASLDPAARQSLLRALQRDAERSGEPLDETGIRADILSAAERGWAAIDRHDDVTRLAAAIVDADGDPVAAIALSGPAYRMEPELERFAGLVVDTARAVGTDLGDGASRQRV